ncbi:MAG TPA: sugar ABC transporter permease [Gemmatimonadales bacterium]|nr:sugar ABC transporter permease [Gemmatimonadales bacterium]
MRLLRWRVVAVVGVAAGLSAPLAVVHWARERAARALAKHDATAVAAYLALVTPGARSQRGGAGGAGAPGADYSLPQLFIRAHALEGLPGLSARFEVYHATAPLIRATAPPLASATLERLRRSVSVHWMDDAGVALAPLLDRDGWDVVGAVTARPAASDGLFSPWLIAPLLLLLVAGAQAVRAMGGPLEHERQTLRQYGAAAVLFAMATFAAVRLAAAGATYHWLGDVRLLMQEATARVPVLRLAPAELAGIARDAEIVPADSGSASPHRRVIAGAMRATINVRLGPGRWLELRARPGESGTAAWLPALLAVAALGPLAVALAVWARGIGPRRRRETMAAWTFLAPSALHLVAFTVLPLLAVPYLSLHRWNPAEPFHQFVGLANFIQVLGDPDVWSAFGHTALYACTVPASLPVALAIALLLGREGRAGAWAGAAFLLPSVVSVVALGLVWEQLYHPGVGVIQGLMARLGFAPVNWLGEPRTALAAVLVVAVWVQLGYQVALFRAGLRSIPRIYLEAALVDGAGAWQRFRRIIVPLLRPMALFALVTGLVSGFQVFTLVVVLTGGGPRHATDVIAFHIYRTAWERLQFGEASAEALLLFALLFVVMWAQVKLLDRRVEYA